MNRSQMRVMVVDDSSEMRGLIRETLAPWEPEILECSDGDEAIQQYGDFLPDWTLMDLRMKRVDGLMAIPKLRERWPDARILLLTAYDSRAVLEEALRRGACLCLSKDRLCELPACLGQTPVSPAATPAPA